MLKEKDVIFYLLFAGRKIPIRTRDEIETLKKFVSLVSTEKKAVRGRKATEKKIDKATRKKKALEMKAKGQTIKEIADKLGASTMTIQRDLKEGVKKE